MERFFNSAGPCDPLHHFMVPARERLPRLDRLIERGQYFVLHAPRQSGKTTAMYAFAAALARSEKSTEYVALVASVEAARAVADVEQAEAIMIDSIALSAGALAVNRRPPPRSTVADAAAGSRLVAWLTLWAESVTPAAIVLFLDEVDALQPAPLLSLLAQLRRGYGERLAGRFPRAVGLIGLRDLRDYLVAVKGGSAPGPSSPFNIKVESLALANFTPNEVVSLIAQHTAETGQSFSEAAVARLMYWSGGQPYLVNALAGRVVDDLVPNRSHMVQPAHIDEAAEYLIRARVTHLDNLAERLREPRVAKVVQAVLLGGAPGDIDTASDDFRYVIDLGVLEMGETGPKPANPMYAEVLVRQLSTSIHDVLPPPWWPWQRADGTLDMGGLIAAFLAWWREHADLMKTAWAEGYPEAVPHLVFMGFLQRVVNGGGTVVREYALGRGRIDLLVSYGRGPNARHAVELKRVPPTRVALESVVDEGCLQLAGYLDQAGLSAGWLIVFDQRPGLSWEDRMWRRDVEVGGKRLVVVGA
jgi:hypothetical protein